MILCLLFIYLASIVKGEVYLYEKFPDEQAFAKWISSKHHGADQGQVKLSAGASPVDPNEDLGLQTSQDARFYGISRKLDTRFTNANKPLVIQFTLKFEKTMDCGGGYVKILGSDIDQEKFHGETPYKIMFGPDICGYSTKKVHVIFAYKGKNHQIKKEIRCEDDTKTHLYTLIVTPDNKYKVLIDNEVKQEGSMEEDWDMLPAKTIDDPKVSKPSDWVEEAMITDPDDKKPDDWDQPKTIVDPNAKKPDDWDDEMDGEWEAPKIDNPAFKGEWKPKQIPNPQYKGPWKAPKIPNPEYEEDVYLYKYDDIGAVGIDVWQVTSGSIFDNILLTDDPAYAKEEGERVWKQRHDGEKKKEDSKEEKEKAAEKLEAEEIDIPKDKKEAKPAEELHKEIPEKKSTEEKDESHDEL